jgi:Asp-tRNA(Asn)/Glu-tRNA(Gln) amidotransferase C subunit
MNYRILIVFFLFFNYSYGWKPKNYINVKDQNNYEKYFSNYYIVIDPIFNNKSQWDYHENKYKNYIFNYVIDYLYFLKDINNILLKYESNNDKKIQTEKYLSIIEENILLLLFLKNICKYDYGILNKKIYNILKKNIFPLLKKINLLIKNTKNKMPIKSLFVIKKYIYNGFLKIRPNNLNNYMLNILLINNYGKLSSSDVFKNYKDFLFFSKNFIQSIIETSKHKITPDDYKILQSTINKISKLIDQINKIILEENFNYDTQVFYDQICDVIYIVNEVFKRNVLLYSNNTDVELLTREIKAIDQAVKTDPEKMKELVDNLGWESGVHLDMIKMLTSGNAIKSIDKYYNPIKNGFVLKPLDQLTATENELWFSAPAVLVSPKQFDILMN